MDLKPLTEAVAAGRELAPADAENVAAALADPAVPAPAKEEFLEALSRRGETPGEIAGLARAFRKRARDPGLSRWAADAIDVCGTGGDRSGTFNISTTVSFALAAAGVPVFKHGNRSITSRCGSADLLEALGIRLDADEALRVRSMEQLNFVFLFAPAFHPAFKEIGPVRRSLAARGVRTVFNLLGPLLNPAAPAQQIVGVFSESVVEPVARAMHALGLEGGMAVSCVDAEGRRYDELTTVGENQLAGFGRHRDLQERFHAGDLGFERAPGAQLAGGDLEENIALLDRVLDGTAPQGLLDTIVLNAAAALFAAGRAESLRDGLGPARELLLGGAVKAWLHKAREFYRA
ncbi:MAG: anthranilate phosphoribosyltransferase [Opitutaceae bacterium]